MTTNNKSTTNASGWLFCSNAYHEIANWFPLSQEQKGDLLDALDNYFITGEEPQMGECEAIIGALFDRMKYSIDKGLTNYKRQANNRDEYNRQRKEKSEKNSDNVQSVNIIDTSIKIDNDIDNSIDDKIEWHYDTANSMYVNIATGETKTYLPTYAICDNINDVPNNDTKIDLYTDTDEYLPSITQKDEEAKPKARQIKNIEQEDLPF